MRPISVIVCLLVALAGPIRTHAAGPQQPINDRHVDEVWQTLRDEPDVNDARRAQIVRVLEHPLTQDVANRYGLDLDDAVRQVPLLGGPELLQLSDRAAAVEPSLAGGGTMVVSTTLIIVALLIVIIILVAD